MDPTTPVFVILVTALACGLVRLVKGPTLPDRVVALDLIAMVFAGMVAARSIRMGQIIYLDVLLVFAAVFFFGTAVFARYVGRHPEESRDD